MVAKTAVVCSCRLSHRVESSVYIASRESSRSCAGIGCLIECTAGGSGDCDGERGEE